MAIFPGSTRPESPFYRQVNGAVSAELKNRGNAYSRKVRSGNSTGSDLAFSYKKTAYAIARCNGFDVGGYSRKVLTTATGQISLYDSTSNKPTIPILNSVEISNEGALGSLVKAKINFTVWPDLNNTGFGGRLFNGLLDSYANPGKELTIKWGWSVNGGGVNSGNFVGYVYNFNWSVNTDLSVTFDVSAVGKGPTSTGFSGEQSNPTPGPNANNVKDAAGNIIPNSDLANIIKQDITDLTNKNPPPTALGPAIFYNFNQTSNNRLQYFGIPLPRGEDDASLPSTAGSSATPAGPRPVDVIYYCSFGGIIQLLDQLITEALPGSKPFIFQIWECFTDRHNTIVSSSPEEVFFPDAGGQMGTYGQVNPFPTSYGGGKYTFDQGTKCGGTSAIGIGAILLSTSLVSRVFKKFVTENQTNIETKNITKLIDELAKEINYAAGEVYQLSTSITEDPTGGTAIISIEDSNMPKSYTECITATPILASANAPIIKSVQISSKPPNASAAAAFVSANAKGVANVSAVDVKTENTTAATQEGEALKAITDLKNSFITRGYGPAFSKDMKAAITKWKRSHGGSDAHWLNKAIYPIDVSITIDGIDGFKFGDVITTNLVPQRYVTGADKMVFTVVKIQHSIKDGVWETTLITKARLAM